MSRPTPKPDSKLQEIFDANRDQFIGSPADFAAPVLDRLKQLLVHKKESTKLSDKIDTWDICHEYIYAARRFLDGPNAEHIALDILTTGWDELSAWQSQINRRIYRAAIGLIVAAIYAHYLEDKGAAVHWGLLTQADDHLDGYLEGGGGRHLLVSNLGIPLALLKRLQTIASDNLSKVTTQNSWKISVAFPEDVVRQLIIGQSEFSFYLAQHSELLEFPLSRSYFGALLSGVEKAKSNIEKKESLETLASYLFALVPGLLPLPNVQDQTFEIDLVVRNFDPLANLRAEMFGRQFIVECKNWKEAVGVRDVGYFLYRMRLTHVHFGVIFSKHGISGKGDESRDATNLIRRAYHEDHSICVVITLDDLKALGRGETTFHVLLLRRIEEIRFGKSY